MEKPDGYGFRVENDNLEPENLLTSEPFARMPYFTTADNCRLYYTFTEPAPDAPTVIFLNGLAQTTTYWHNQARIFTEDCRVLRYDGRAQGRSEVGSEPLTPSLHVDDLRALYDHLGIEVASLVGLSHGAYIAVAFAERHPGNVSRLVVCNLRAGRYGDSAIVARWLQKLHEKGLAAYARDVIQAATGRTFRTTHAHLIDMMAKAVAARNSQAGLTQQLEAMQAYPPAGQITLRKKIPTLIINGGEDEIVPAADAGILARSLRAARATIATAGHSLPVETPDEFNSLVRDFLNSDLKPTT